MIKNKNIEKARAKYAKIKNAAYKESDSYERATVKACCYECTIFDGEADIPFIKRHQKCPKKGACGDVVKCHQKSVEADEELAAAQREYAKVIFEELSQIKPTLISRATKKDVKWNDVFPASFTQVPSDYMGTLVALIELSGGKYRIK